MCGRFTLHTPADALATLFDLPEAPALAPRYNIAPTQPVAIVRPNAAATGREWALTLWGLIPSWSKDPSFGARLINARSETVAEKPSFRAAFKRRRCLIPADGFYEWQKAGKRKQPYYMGMDDGAPFAFAGLWEAWQGPDGGELQSCTILTTTPNELLEPIHNRMPVILAPEDYDDWLDHASEHPRDLDRLQHLMRPFPAEKMRAYPVSTYVNNARNEGLACIEPLDAV
ncbi:MAG: SOS response-associated peptidase [Caldilineaceae bacterium]|nr:SOS response-associated peptidase [Caldilineaceae bacterium]